MDRVIYTHTNGDSGQVSSQNIEVEIILKLKAEADKKDQVTLGFLYAVARSVVGTYWRKKYRERRRFCRLYEGDKGLMIAGS